jgi:hypothetical protein
VSKDELITVRREALELAVSHLASTVAEYDDIWLGRLSRLARMDAERAAVAELEEKLK